jgi:hypothetical protein
MGVNAGGKPRKYDGLAALFADDERQPLAAVA